MVKPKSVALSFIFETFSDTFLTEGIIFLLCLFIAHGHNLRQFWLPLPMIRAYSLFREAFSNCHMNFPLLPKALYREHLSFLVPLFCVKTPSWRAWETITSLHLLNSACQSKSKRWFMQGHGYFWHFFDSSWHQFYISQAVMGQEGPGTVS